MWGRKLGWKTVGAGVAAAAIGCTTSTVVDESVVATEAQPSVAVHHSLKTRIRGIGARDGDVQGEAPSEQTSELDEQEAQMESTTPSNRDAPHDDVPAENHDDRRASDQPPT